MNRSGEIIKNHLIFTQICRYYGGVRGETYYDVLGISKDASKQDIRLAYLKLSKEKHPDKNFNGCKESHADFVKINEAYNVLSKSYLRDQYDEKLRFNYNHSYTSSHFRRPPFYRTKGFDEYDTYYEVKMDINRNNMGYKNAKYSYNKNLYSTTRLVLLCMMIWTLGSLFYSLIIMKPLTFNGQSLRERYKNFEIEQEKIRIRARKYKEMYNDNEIALSLLRKYEEDLEGDKEINNIIFDKSIGK